MLAFALLAVAFSVAAELGILDKQGTPIGMRLAACYFAVTWIYKTRRYLRALKVARFGDVEEGIVRRIDGQRWPSLHVDGEFGSVYCGTLDTDLKTGDAVLVVRERRTGDIGVFTGKSIAMSHPSRPIRLVFITLTTFLVLAVLYLWV